MTTERLSRPPCPGGAATVGIGVPLLAACGGDDAATDDGATAAAAATISCRATGAALGRRRVRRERPGHAAPARPRRCRSTVTPSRSTGRCSPDADIPEGGGAIFADEQVVVDPARGG